MFSIIDYMIKSSLFDNIFSPHHHIVALMIRINAAAATLEVNKQLDQHQNTL